MPSRIDIGPEGGPFVELDESSGAFIIRVPSDQVDINGGDLVNAVLKNGTVSGGSLNGVSLGSSLDASENDINNVAGLDVSTFISNIDADSNNLTGLGLLSSLDVETPQITDADDGTSYDVATLASGAVFGGYSDVSGSRSLNTEFQNTSGGPLEVVVEVSPDSDTSNLQVDGLASATSGLFGADKVDGNNIRLLNASFDSAGSISTRLFVPDSWYYQVNTFSDGSELILNWKEQEVA